MRHGSLFSGIGGFDLAAQWMGWENVFHCEKNDFCKRILKHYWPNAESFDDIKQSSFSRFAGTIDIISGGFPCQPYSHAGKRKGKEDDRHLWPEMLRAIREIRPRWVVGENVPGLLSWERGMVLKEIKADLEAAEFEVFPPLILPACGKNAPHRRDRLWIVAHSEINSFNHENRSGFNTQEVSQKRLDECGTTPNTGLQRQEKSEEQSVGIEQFYESGVTTNSNDDQRFKRGLYQAEQKETERHAGTFNSRFFRGEWEDFPTVSPIRGGNDGLPAKLVKQCLEALGNAVVPQLVYEIFKAIEQTQKPTTL